MNNLTSVLRHASRAREILDAVRASSNWLDFTKGYLRVGEVTYPFDLRLRSGQRLVLQDREELAIAWHVCVRECYRARRTDRVIIDAGANVGVFTVHAAHIAQEARIFSVEPHPETFDRLTDQVRRNALDGRVSTHRLGLAGSDGPRVMVPQSGLSPNNSLRLTGDGPGDGIEVECRTLATLLCELDLHEVDYLKMDIEGAEHEVLIESPVEVLRAMRRLDVEIHEVNRSLGFSPERLIRHVESAGHRLVDWRQDAFNTGLARFDRQDGAASSR